MSLIESLRGFSFNGKHNHDFDVVMHSKTIESPSKKKIKASVPFMQGSYDFSTVATNGEITYDERKITIILGLPTYSKESLQTLYSKTLEWIVDVNQSQLIFDDTPGYYYMAEVVDSTTLEQVMEFGLVTITFIAYPFKTSIDYAGSETWDLFNFELDYLQEVGFNIAGSKDIIINNSGRSVCPIVKVIGGNITVTKGNIVSTFELGEHKNWAFRLQNGINNVNISGTGYIEFIFKKEML